MNFPLEAFTTVSAANPWTYVVFGAHRFRLRLHPGNGRVRRFAKTRGAVLFQGADGAQGHVHGDRGGHDASVRRRRPGADRFQSGLGQSHLPGFRRGGRTDHGRRLHRRRLLPDDLAGVGVDRQDRRHAVHAGRIRRRLPVRRDRALLRSLVQQRRILRTADARPGFRRLRPGSRADRRSDGAVHVLGRRTAGARLRPQGSEPGAQAAQVRRSGPARRGAGRAGPRQSIPRGSLRATQLQAHRGDRKDGCARRRWRRKGGHGRAADRDPRLQRR